MGCTAGSGLAAITLITALKIQISAQAKEELDVFHEFRFEHRGLVDIKVFFLDNIHEKINGHAVSLTWLQ